jgi:UPF0716 protein FxsA
LHLIHFVEIRLIFMKLFLFILAGVILEVFVWIGVGDLVGSMWYVFFWFIAAFFIGMSLIRKYSAGLMPQMQQMQAGQMGADPALTNNLQKIIAGFLLLIPGFGMMLSQSTFKSFLSSFDDGACSKVDASSFLLCA